MEKLIALIEKGKPFFNAIARNKYRSLEKLNATLQR